MPNKLTVTVKQNSPHPLDLTKALNYLKSHKTMVGIPADTAGRNGQITNAQRLHIHTNGSPAQGIPARPVIEPAMEQPDVQAQIAGHLRQAALAALSGSLEGAASALDQAGLCGENAAKAYFTSGNGWAPNKPATIRKKGADTPLIDTGALRQAITHVVK